MPHINGCSSASLVYQVGLDPLRNSTQISSINVITQLKGQTIKKHFLKAVDYNIKVHKINSTDEMNFNNSFNYSYVNLALRMS